MKKHISSQAIIYMLISCFCSALMVNLVRHLSDIGMHPFEMIFWRNLLAFAMLLPFVPVKKAHFFRTNKLKAHFIRAVSGIVAMSMLFYAITKMNLALGTAITFAAPLFTAVIAWFVFNDRPDKHKICALIFGFLGCIIVIRPGLEGFNPYSILMFCAAIFWGVNGILVKKLGATEHPLKIIFYQTFFMIFLSLPLAWLVWKSPTPDQIYVVIVIALVSNVLQYTLAKALSLTQFSVILPFDYTRLIFTAIIAYYSFGETVDEFTIIGSLVIMSSAIYTAVRERRKPTTIAMN